jgi:hypothetical protein
MLLAHQTVASNVDRRARSLAAREASGRTLDARQGRPLEPARVDPDRLAGVAL